jgi:4-diphosphocytidyl-2-C-methyl-D-erythritol kinase
MAREITVHAPAKINLALHVTGRRGDGYHLLDSLVAFAQTADLISVCRAGELSLDIEGPFAAALPAEGNLVLKAGRLLAGLADRHGLATSGAAITLTKNLPVASGIGGGSADAAATLVALRRLWRLPLDIDLAPLAAQLGADVPMCLVSRPLRAQGIGEKLTSVALAGDMRVLLVNPMVETPTAAVFRALAGRFGPALSPLPQGGVGTDWLSRQRNDLEAPAIELFPVIGEALSLLRQCGGVSLARMSGSGATCFGVFADAQALEAATSRIAAQRPQWWLAATRIPATGPQTSEGDPGRHEQD